MIVACDGVWDELSNEQAVEIVDKVKCFCWHSHSRSGIVASISVQHIQRVMTAFWFSAQLLKKHPEPGAPIAEMFIDNVLKSAVKRIKSEIPEEKHITLEKMKARPVGKADYTSRSCLHDDITAIIIQFSGVGSLGVQIPEAETPCLAHGSVGTDVDDAVLKAENAELRTQVEQLQHRVQQLELELSEAKRSATMGGGAPTDVDDDELESDV